MTVLVCARTVAMVLYCGLAQGSALLLQSQPPRVCVWIHVLYFPRKLQQPGHILSMKLRQHALSVFGDVPFYSEIAP